ncbi:MULTISPECIES: LCP family protein [unclassified Streptomyces]|uniref:LCP family protein n=1 Tax=unclassified Streptomyces TaxID=2593676 RepID=UPI00099D16DD|nr:MULTISPECIES: LCP family protein [unclassified Streptomyces]MCH0556762.1 LCP family protein [Streptomyces sp. MUM 16J]
MARSSVEEEGVVPRARRAGGRGTSSETDHGGNGQRRSSGHRRGAGSGPPRPRRRILRWSAITLAVVILGTAGAGYLYYEHLNANIQKDKLNLGDTDVPKATPNAAGQTPLNVLLIGSDSRNTKEDLKLGGSKADVGRPPLADVQMLVHVSADRTNMSVVSLPRDTMIPIPKCTDPHTGKQYPALSLAMANESLGRGGPGCTVATWQKLTHIHIDHFMMVDFSGVVSMADAIGGVPVCVKQNVWSHTSEGHGSGLKLKKGTTYVKGEQALEWLRTRYGFEDGTDLGRTHAQHMYMNAMVRQLRENATLSNPGKMRDLAETATKSLKVDEDLGTIKKLYDLSEEFKKVPTKRITMTTLPTEQWSRDHNRLVPTHDADQLISMVRDDIPLDGRGTKHKAEQKSKDPAAPDDRIAVQVRNGTGADGQAPAPQRAGAVAQILRSKGFTEVTVDATAAAETKTSVLFPSADLEGDAQAVAEGLGVPLKQVRKSTDVSGVTLIVGADWRTGTAYKAAKEPTTAPSSAAVLPGDKKDACMTVQKGFTW